MVRRAPTQVQSSQARANVVTSSCSVHHVVGPEKPCEPASRELAAAELWPGAQPERSVDEAVKDNVERGARLGFGTKSDKGHAARVVDL